MVKLSKEDCDRTQITFHPARFIFPTNILWIGIEENADHSN
jgi:hypothetical protein